MKRRHNYHILLLVFLMAVIFGCGGGGDAPLPVLSQTASYTMAWGPNTEADLAGYYVYYGTSQRTNVDPNNCPTDGYKCGYKEKIRVGKVTTHVFQLPRGKYYFAVTAFDTAGNESAFSNEFVKTK